MPRHNQPRLSTRTDADFGPRRHAEPSTAPLERRTATRVSGVQLKNVGAHLLDGPTVEIVNISKTGILTRSRARLMPGSMIGLRVATESDTYVLFGRVVRSMLISADAVDLQYESALAFTRDFPLVADDARVRSVGEPAEQRPGHGQDGNYPLEVGQPAGVPVVLTATAFADDRHDVLRTIAGDE